MSFQPVLLCMFFICVCQTWVRVDAGVSVAVMVGSIN